ncbi:C40 family peptidase [Solibacillus sp. CAU 1738]|uniref:C40 family peptidase n=1 Tax=Solibacillus sp. CAU 1738 TaxID=3140363 RepID=UPI0032608099
MKKKYLLPIFAAFMLFAGTDSNTAEAASANELTTTAYQYIGVPYVYGGTTTSGLDCSGYTRLVYSDLGIKLSRTSTSQYQEGKAVSKGNLQTGDLVFFNTSGSGISHVGIYIGNNKFIHSQTGDGVSVTNINDPYYWGKRYVGAKRITTFSDSGKTVASAGEVKDAAIDFSIYASRGEVAIQLAKAMGLDTSNTNSSFTDVKPTSKYAGAVAALQKEGVFTGDENGKFNPGSPLTRAQMAKVLVIAFDLKQAGDAPSFTDVPASHWSHEYVSTLASTGITVGKGDGTFGLKENVTLKQLAAFIDRATR